MDDLIHRHVYHNEKQIRRAQENSIKLSREIETTTEIHDMSGMGLVHRKGLSMLRTVINIDQTYYPERLGRVCVCDVLYCYYYVILSIQLFFINVPRYV